MSGIDKSAQIVSVSVGVWTENNETNSHVHFMQILVTRTPLKAFQMCDPVCALMFVSFAEAQMSRTFKSSRTAAEQDCISRDAGIRPSHGS